MTWQAPEQVYISPGRSPRTVLVCMPWHAVGRSSLAIGVLRAACAENGLPVPSTYYGGLRFAEFLLECSDGKLAPYEYMAVSDIGFTHCLGDWVFAGALNGPDFGLEGMAGYATRQGIPMRSVNAMREYADAFCDLVVDELIAFDPELVGFSTTFMQNVPSLAVARRLKRRRPDITVVFGGGNCDGPMGIALHREFSFVDLVLRGEADETFPQLLRALAAGDAEALGTVPGLCWRDAGGRQRVNQQARLVPPANIVKPDFDDWSAAFDASPVSGHVDPELVVESSRGCWWGQVHHCTFCGLNGTSMAFRAKSSAAFVDELTDLVHRHRVLNVMMADNILEPDYLRDALPRLAGRDWDLCVYYELKANLTTDQVGVLAASGVRLVQPGIESFVDDVLDRMDKGVRAVHNVRTMRDFQSAGLTVTWNWLYGFPGEQEAAYGPVLAQLPALVHLQPPSSTARIEMDRFSPYFENPALGFPERAPAEPYRYVYDLSEQQLQDLVYLFDTPPRGLTEEQVAPLKEAVEVWIRHYPASSLHQLAVDGIIVLRDRRVGWPAADHLLEAPREQAAWRELEHGRSTPGLLRRLAEADQAWDIDGLTYWLSELRERGLVFTEGDRWVSLATTSISASAPAGASGPLAALAAAG
jgi:ribosomal peptide maturation radical SAM protein 1